MFNFNLKDIFNKKILISLKMIESNVFNHLRLKLYYDKSTRVIILYLVFSSYNEI